MANYELLGLNESTPQAVAPTTGDTGVVTNLQVTGQVVGNLGIGTAPFAWGGARALDISASGAFYADGLVVDYSAGITQNAYRVAGGGFKYKASGVAPSLFRLLNNTFSFFSAPAGTAGDDISFSEYLSLDGNGNLIQTLNSSAPALGTNSTMALELTSNTALKIAVRGTDGTTRSVTLTLS